MKQVLQNLANGETSLVNVPCPKAKNSNVLIKTSKTLVSVGTERMLVDFGKASWIEKARSQPDKVKMVLEKAKTDGLSATYDAVKSKLDQPLPLGYCNVGTVIDSSDTGFEVGARVVSNGNHAEVVRVPKNLVAAVPDDVDDESASFTVLGAIAMQGIRLIKPTIGETVVVTGLGLIGLLAVQILKANGCRVLGIDFDSAKCELAKQFGAEVVDLSKGEDALVAAEAFSRGRGVDAVLVTASSKSNDIMHQAATMSRKRGRIVLVGVVGLELSRADFYEKELTFQVSCSYGPGRYDEEYEDKGKDYPFAFVRWTEQRNFEAILDLMASGAVNVKPLVSHRFAIDDAKAAYEKLDDRGSLGIVLDYSKTNTADLTKATVALNEQASFAASNGNVAFIGGGNYASRVLIPAFKNAGANLTSIVTSGGISAVHHGKKNGFANATTDMDQALDSNTDAVVIATQHNLHASQAIAALEKGKHVFVEKPLALNHDEIDAIESAQKAANTMVMVGYNRRFAPHVQKMKELLMKKAAPKTFIMTMNAGDIPAEHWTQDPAVGGGRIIGEACHYIDLMRFLAGSKIKSFSAIKMSENDYVEVTEDKAIITITFEDGSVGSIHYFANGGKSFPKERVEVFCDDAVLQLDNFRKLTGYGWKGFNKMNLWSQDKGQSSCSEAFMNAVQQGGQNPIPNDEIFEIARVSVDIANLLRS
ncbi:1,5-anhydro-D-fructose reductase [Pseudoalteromonas sp. P1-13-1a]|uniref:bi-domain-containing oxidoreductase n=1 Tax=Pseudoalteromonas sp. P1-13-1a TaxID=1723756 RepID=UPI0006D67FA4|nr:bi-domain-containing oxidoreductase [Pseudoalteromonas sp. P1-13-1a]KPZ52384.1 1,5-anhydro-D-fructose reductase [Pseudoalteromonas sp. P1-13-1a]